MKIFIRADGGKAIGMGHVMRMLTLAIELNKRNQVIFLCIKDDNEKYKAGIEKIKESNFEVIEISYKNKIANIIEVQKQQKADILISDTYEVNEEYFVNLKKYFKLTGYIDDSNKIFMDVDFIVNQNINAKILDYSKNVNKDTSLFLGPEYCMLRKEFSIAKEKKKEKKCVEDVLLTVGGMDDDNNTLKLLKAIKGLKQRIHVVIGKAFDKNIKEAIYNFAKDYKNIYLYEDASMSKLMALCDIAISSCGSTIYELCAMNVPTIGIIIADNQSDVAELLEKKKIIIGNINMNEFSNNVFKKLIDSLIENNELRKNLKDSSKNIFNLNGAENLAESVEELYNKKYGGKYD